MREVLGAESGGVGGKQFLGKNRGSGGAGGVRGGD